jgi:hypothetical protein
MAGKEIRFFVYGGGRAKSAAARLLQWLLPIMLSLGCSVSSAQIEPDAGKSKTWVPRTFESNATAFYWQSGRSNWNNVIDQKIFEYRLDMNPPRAARVYALAYIAAYDATVACWDAKYT